MVTVWCGRGMVTVWCGRGMVTVWCECGMVIVLHAGNVSYVNVDGFSCFGRIFIVWGERLICNVRSKYFGGNVLISIISVGLVYMVIFDFYEVC